MSKEETFVLDIVHSDIHSDIHSDAHSDARSDIRGALHGVARTPQGAGPHPTVVICHGFKGFMEWGFFPPLADLLVNRGFATVSFNFTGSGMRPGDALVTDPAAFHGAKFSHDVADVLRILEAIGTEILQDQADPERLALVGHSRGGGASVLAAADPKWRDRLRALITWNAVSTFRRFKDFEDTWRKQGELPVANARTGQELTMGVEILEELEANADALDILAAAGRRTVPWLILQGSEDQAVPPFEGEALAENAADPAELRVIEGGSHTFNARHPFAGPTPQLTEAMNATQTWLRRYCW